jgi:flagellar motor protein MotB
MAAVADLLKKSAAPIPSRGVEQPVQDNQTEYGRALNRRVEILLVR